MTVREQILEALKEAMRAREEVKISTLRLIQAAITDRDIAARSRDRSNGCDDIEIITLLAKMVKQREESIIAYESGGRLELAERERAEVKIIHTFMPEQMTETEIETAAQNVISEIGAKSLKDMGRSIALLKERYSGKMNFSKAGSVIKNILSRPS